MKNKSLKSLTLEEWIEIVGPQQAALKLANNGASFSTADKIANGRYLKVKRHNRKVRISIEKALAQDGYQWSFAKAKAS